MSVSTVYYLNHVTSYLLLIHNMVLNLLLICLLLSKSYICSPQESQCKYNCQKQKLYPKCRCNETITCNVSYSTHKYTQCRYTTGHLSMKTIHIQDTHTHTYKQWNYIYNFLADHNIDSCYKSKDGNRYKLSKLASVIDNIKGYITCNKQYK